MKSEKYSIKTSTHSYTCTGTCVHTHSLFHAQTHIQLGKKKKKKIVSQTNTGKVLYIHVIYPKFIKQNKRHDHTGSKWKNMQKSTALL